MDIRAIVQSTAICLSVDCNAVLHLCDHWDAGTYRLSHLNEVYSPDSLYINKTSQIFNWTTFFAVRTSLGKINKLFPNHNEY